MKFFHNHEILLISLVTVQNWRTETHYQETIFSTLVMLYQWIWMLNLYQNLIIVLLIVAVCTVLFWKLFTIWRKKEPSWQEICNFFPRNVQNETFKILKMLKNDMKFAREALWINSNISNRDKNTTLVIFLFCHYCWSLSWWTYWRSLMLWNSTSWSRLKLAVQIQLSFHPCNPFLINNC